MTQLMLESEWTALQAREAARTAGAFLDAAGTATGRATFYNTKEEQARAEARVHDKLLAIHRGLYALLATLPGVTDHTRMRVVSKLLGTPGGDAGERAILEFLVSSLPAPRRFRLFEALRRARVNNARTRRIILRTILGSPKLELWSVKYRRKLRRALAHALGRRTLSIVGAILAKGEAERSAREKAIVHRAIGARTECVAFILGHEDRLTLPLLLSYCAAKADLDEGRTLPLEVLEGLRSTYHPERAPSAVLELTRDRLTRGQRLGVQRRAEQAGIEVEFDPRRYDPVRLYIYAFERGMSAEIERALDDKAAALAARLPFSYARVGILVDASASMAGATTQAMRPIASALAVRDVLCAAAETVSLVVCGGDAEGRLVRPQGDTSPALALVEILKASPDAVFVLTDGYENAPAGRLAEVMAKVRELGIETPVYQVSPVFGAEAGGLRRLAECVPALPMARPESFGLALLREALDQDPLPALDALVRLSPFVRKEMIR